MSHSMVEVNGLLKKYGDRVAVNGVSFCVQERENFTVLLLLTLSALGGCFVPRFIMPGWLRTIGLVTPHAWALDAYQDLLVRGYGLRQVLPKVDAEGLNMNIVVVNSAELFDQLPAAQQRELFGKAVCGSDDVNEDGYADIIVGAPGFSGSTGKVYVFYGGEIVDNIPDLVMTGETAGDQFGSSICVLDVNMDGFGDIVVGAPGYNGGNGKLYLFLGDGSIDNQADWVYSSTNSGEGLGSSLNSAGFFNEDGFEDLIAGAAAYNSNVGRAYVFYGNGTLVTTPSLTMSGSFPGDNFGCSVSKLGDVNEDDFSDLIIGASGYTGGTGRASIYYGGNAPDGLVDATFDGDLASSSFGSTVAAGGDLDGDGVEDIVVSASAARTSGQSYLFLGSDLTAPLTPVFMQAIGGNAQADLFWLPNVETDFYRYYIYGDTLENPTVLMDSTSALNRLDTNKTVSGLINGKTYFFRITAKDIARNESSYSDPMQATPSEPAALGTDPQMPLRFVVQQNYPNPFNPTTVVSFTLPEAARVTVTLYDILGQQVQSKYLGQQVKGTHQWRIDGSTLGSGVYFYRVRAKGAQAYSATRRMLLLR